MSAPLTLDPPQLHVVAVRRSAARRRAVAVLPGIVFMLVFAWRCSANPYGNRRFTLFDDAMISMTYGRTLADTGELVWFPGAERVQGITNPLWTLYMSFLHMIGLDGSAAALAVTITSGCLLVATAILVADLVERCLTPGRSAQTVPLAAAGIVPFAYPLVYWSLRGMEVGALAFAATLLVRSLAPAWAGASGADRPPSTLPTLPRIGMAVVACVGGVATRLDFAPLALVVVVCAARWAPGIGIRARVLGVVGGSVLASVGAVLGLQRWYYGTALPNTYRLKVEGFSVWTRLERGTMVLGKLAPVLALVALAVVVASLAGSMMARRTALVALAVLATSAAYSSWVGGDAWESDLLLNRYVSVALPLAILATMVAVGVVIDRASAPSLRQVVLVTLPLLGTTAAVGLVTNPFGYEVGASARTFAFLAGVVLAGSAAASANWSGRIRRSAAMAIGATALVGLIGGGPLMGWIAEGAAYADDDQMQSEYGLAMNRLTDPDQVIGTVWAGAPAYYAERPMVDFLGKSDPVVAAAEPRGLLHPGHNKWDHDHSIGELLPRVAIQIWATDLETLQMIGVNGYNFRCFAIGTGIGGAYFKLGAGIREELLTICDGLPA